MWTIAEVSIRTEFWEKEQEKKEQKKIWEWKMIFVFVEDGKQQKKEKRNAMVRFGNRSNQFKVGAKDKKVKNT